jgi:hypothetical protein
MRVQPVVCVQKQQRSILVYKMKRTSNVGFRERLARRMRISQQGVSCADSTARGRSPDVRARDASVQICVHGVQDGAYSLDELGMLLSRRYRLSTGAWQGDFVVEESSVPDSVVWNAMTGCVSSLTRPLGRNILAALPDGSVVCYQQRRIYVLQPDGTERTIADTGEDLDAMAMACTGDTVVFYKGADVLAFSVASGEHMWKYRFKQGAFMSRYSADGFLLFKYESHSCSTACVQISAHKGTVVRRRVGGRLSRMTCGNGEFFVTVRQQAGRVMLVHRRTNGLVHEICVGAVHSMAPLSSHGTVAVLYTDPDLLYSSVAVFAVHGEQRVFRLADTYVHMWSMGDSLLVLSGHGDSVMLLDADSGARKRYGTSRVVVAPLYRVPKQRVS